MQRLSYDACGRRRDPDNWNNYSNLAEMKFDCGYTGHEHLDMFILINMNTRLYDPILGQFQSADPFVQMPENPQSYNRYAYAMNNPLNYTDPDGVRVHLVVGAAIGRGAGASDGFTNGFGNGLLDGQGFCQALGQGGMYGLIGGFSGALLGGLAGGINSYRGGRDFWDGDILLSE